MSGTSMDGVDAALASFSESDGRLVVRTVASASRPFPSSLQTELHALQAPGDNEVHREALAANQLARLYAETALAAVKEAGIEPAAIRALGAHGQTIRHRPELCYTRQIGNPALLAELTGIDVVADLRSRDIAAGGQGAPLVPAFHYEVFGDPAATRVVVNIGGIANISVLAPGQSVIGFDTGPGNVLLDYWCMRHLGQAYDADGAWAASGRVLPDLLQIMLAEPYLDLPPPKSTGRDLFHAGWLETRLAAAAAGAPGDVQATLTEYTATTIARAILRYARGTSEVYVCGGGACNATLLAALTRNLEQRDAPIRVDTTAALGVEPQLVEALAFAWLAHRHVARLPGNLPS
ncbi:MAG TPA: anhydro-N-acetylmuramic acid kinase, partial [Noviherbaspirillum sp.]|nr:anhydro-N-acetylmuramic acid kinase [Noviherbaspirillum sp.]